MMKIKSIVALTCAFFLFICGTVFAKEIKTNSSLAPKKSLLCKSHSDCGKRGPRGHRGHRGHKGKTGYQGSSEVGPAGASGETGIVGGPYAAADFYAVVTPNAPVGFGTDVIFPIPGSTTSPDISYSGNSRSQILLVQPGIYQIFFIAAVAEGPAQFSVCLDSGSGLVEQAFTIVGRNSATAQLINVCSIQTTMPNSRITIRNALAAGSLNLLSLAGGPVPVSAHLVITRIF
jgi:hypothetical protein